MVSDLCGLGIAPRTDAERFGCWLNADRINAQKRLETAKGIALAMAMMSGGGIAAVCKAMHAAGVPQGEIMAYASQSALNAPPRS